VPNRDTISHTFDDLLPVLREHLDEAALLHLDQPLTATSVLDLVPGGG
jgi:hypothetical protein